MIDKLREGKSEETQAFSFYFDYEMRTEFIFDYFVQKKYTRFPYIFIIK